MPRGDARRPPFERFGDLSPDDFERLVFHLAWMDNQQVVRLLAPDGGLDTVLSDTTRQGKAQRGWQAKRHTGRIDWEDCEQSLDRAVTLWEPREVTFVFPRDLNAREHQTFAERMGLRHAAVQVDYWGASHLQAMLASAEGRRVRAAFFEEDDAVAVAERLLRAGTPLRSGEDFLLADQSIAEATAAADPDYDWVIHRVPGGGPEPAATEGALLRLAFATETATAYADLVARHGSPAKRPGVTMIPDDSPEGGQARQWLDDLLAGGGRLALREGVTVRFRDLPAPFGDLISDQPHRLINLKAVPVVPPYYARLTADPSGEPIAVDVDLVPQDAPDEWDALLAGQVGSLEVSLRFRWLVNEGRGESRLTFHYAPAGAPHEVEAKCLRWLIAVGRGGELQLADRTGQRPTTVQRGEPMGVEPWMELWARLHEDLATLADAAAARLPAVPAEITPDDARGIAQVAALIRAGQVPATVHQPWIRTLDPAASKVGAIITTARLEATMVALLFGERVPVARQIMKLPPMVVRERIAVPGGWEIRMMPLGADQAEVIAEIIPLQNWTERSVPPSTSTR